MLILKVRLCVVSMLLVVKWFRFVLSMRLVTGVIGWFQVSVSLMVRVGISLGSGLVKLIRLVLVLIVSWLCVFSLSVRLVERLVVIWVVLLLMMLVLLVWVVEVGCMLNLVELDRV